MFKKNKMNNVGKSKKGAIVIILISLLAIMIIAPLGVFGIVQLVVYLSDKKISKDMISIYSNDDNYVTCRATIEDVNTFNNYVVSDLISIDDKEIPRNRPDRITIFSSDIEATIVLLEPEIDKEIEFKTCFGFYGTIRFLPVVQIVVDGVEILTFEDGKNSLIKWATF